MALQTEVITHAGETRPNQYVKVFQVDCDKENIEMHISFAEPANKELVYETSTQKIPYELESGVNPIEQSYIWLKSTVYSESIDV